MEIPTMYKKGNRVQYTQNDITSHGTVTKGGTNKITVVLDGGKLQTTGHPALFQPSTKKLPKDVPNPMDKYSIKGYKEIQGHGDSRTFNCTIYKNNKPIIAALNNGMGGCNEYRTSNQNDLKIIFEDIKTTMTQFGYDEMIEPLDTWIEWYQHARPFGITLEQEIQDFKKSLEAFR